MPGFTLPTPEEMYPLPVAANERHRSQLQVLRGIYMDQWAAILRADHPTGPDFTLHYRHLQDAWFRLTEAVRNQADG